MLDRELEQGVVVVDLERPADGDPVALVRRVDQSGTAAQGDLGRGCRVQVRVQGVATVEFEVQLLGRPRDDEGVEPLVDDRDGDGMDPGQVVAAHGGEQHLELVAGVDQPPALACDLRRGVGEFGPGHHACPSCLVSERGGRVISETRSISEPPRRPGS